MQFISDQQSELPWPLDARQVYIRVTSRVFEDGSFFEVHVPVHENGEALNHMNHKVRCRCSPPSSNRDNCATHRPSCASKEVEAAPYMSLRRYIVAEPVLDPLSGKVVEGKSRIQQLVVVEKMGGVIGGLGRCADHCLRNLTPPTLPNQQTRYSRYQVYAPFSSRALSEHCQAMSQKRKWLMPRRKLQSCRGP